MSDAAFKPAFDPFSCYQQNFSHITDVGMPTPFTLWQSEYQLLNQNLIKWQLRLTIPDDNNSPKSAIEKVCQSALKVLQKFPERYLIEKSPQNPCQFVLVIDVAMANALGQITTITAPSFGSDYFLESFIVDLAVGQPLLQVFSNNAWQAVLETLISPVDIMTFSGYHHQQLVADIERAEASFYSEIQLLQQFLNSSTLFDSAIAIDNALINADIQEAPTTDLVNLRLAQQSDAALWNENWQKLWQSGMLWLQLSEQMVSEKLPEDQAALWQGILLDESLISRHELIAALLNHKQQPATIRESGYVIHQHSLSRLGRHYVLIFHGTSPQKIHSKSAITQNLSQIAHDVATRLPLRELNEVIVIGIDFVDRDGDTWIDMDLFIQPVEAMTPKERQLTRQLQKLQQKQAQTPPKFDIKQAGMRLNMTVSSKKT